jgi:hypothetical protein
MTPPDAARDRVVQAAERVEKAAGEWNAVDFTLIGECVSALEVSAADLSAAFTVLQECRTSPSGLRANLLNLKRSTGRLERLVDASAAFLRSAPGLACDQPVLYQADGAICQAALEMGGVQG